jgi:hypothetical protein
LGDDADEKSASVYTAKKIGRTMSKYWRQFTTVFQMSAPRTLNGRTVYQVQGLTAAGKSQVGLVDFKSDFPKNLHAHNEKNISVYASDNPPNPPNTIQGDAASRARDNMPSSSLEGERESIADDGVYHEF